MKAVFLMTLGYVFLAQIAGAQTPTITDADSGSKPVLKYFGGSSPFRLKVDNASGFTVVASPGASLAGNWVRYALGSSAKDSCLKVVYLKYPDKITITTTTAYVCVDAVLPPPIPNPNSPGQSLGGYYPAILNFITAGRVAARLTAELQTFPAGYLQLGADNKGDGSLEGHTFDFSASTVPSAPQTVFANVVDSLNSNALHPGIKISSSAYDANGNKVNWFNIQPLDPAAVSPVQYRISIDPNQVPRDVTDLTGSYIQFDSAPPYVGESFILASGTITRPAATLSFNSTPVQLACTAGRSSNSQSVSVSASDGATALPFSYRVEPGSPWLRVAPGGSLNTPATLSISADCSSITSPFASGAITVLPNGATTGQQIAVSLTVTPATGPVSSVNPAITQIADGGAWKTTLLLTNPGAQTGSYTLRFWNDSGSPTPVSLTGFPDGPQISGSVAPAGLNTIVGRAPDSGGTTVAWADLVTGGTVSGLAVLRQSVAGRPDFEASIPLTAPVSNRLLIPFDNTSGFTTSVALSNPGSAATSVNLTVHDINGAVLRSEAPLNLAALGHTSFVSSTAYPSTAGRRGVMELSSAAAFSAIAFRFNDSGAFTTLTPVPDLPASTASQTISQVVDGGAWKTTILLTNTGSQSASYTLRFWQDSGTAVPLSFNGGAPSSQFAGNISPNGLAVIESAAIPDASTAVAWATLVSSGSVGGVAVLRQRVPGRPDFEAAVPVSSFQSRVLVPFDNTRPFTTSIAIANPNTQPISVNLTIRDENGQIISTEAALNLLAQGHQSFVVPTNYSRTVARRGVLEFSSPGNAISAIALRFNDTGAFTSLNPIAGQ